MLQSFINLFNKHLLMMCGVSDMKVMILWSTKSEYITSTVLKSLSSPYRESWVQVGSEGRQIHRQSVSQWRVKVWQSPLLLSHCAKVTRAAKNNDLTYTTISQNVKEEHTFAIMWEKQFTYICVYTIAIYNLHIYTIYIIHIPYVIDIY